MNSTDTVEAPISPGMAAVDEAVRKSYEHGFITDIETEVMPPGLSEEVVRRISAKKEEPEEKPADPEPAPVEAKAGRTISSDTRAQIENAINLLEQASGALEQLLSGAEAQGTEGKDAPDGSAPKQRSSDEGSDEEVFKQWLLQRQVLRAVNTATSEALAKSKLFIKK